MGRKQTENDKNENLNTPSNTTSLDNDYTIDIPDVEEKSGLLTTIKNFFFHRNQKLLTSGKENTPHITYQSILSLWRLGDFKKALFNTFDKTRNFISKPQSEQVNKNTLNIEIIGNNEEKSLHPEPLKENPISPIIPKTKSSVTSKMPDAKNITHSTNTSNSTASTTNTSNPKPNTLEVGNINTNAIEENIYSPTNNVQTKPSPNQSSKLPKPPKNKSTENPTHDELTDGR